MEHQIPTNLQSTKNHDDVEQTQGKLDISHDEMKKKSNFTLYQSHDCMEKTQWKLESNHDEVKKSNDKQTYILQDHHERK